MKKEKPTLTESEAWGFNSMMVTAAFRYCCGRQTYIVGACADWLVDNWAKFPQSVHDVIKRDLEEKFTQDDEARKDQNSKYRILPLGWDCDRKDWERVRALWQEKTTFVMMDEIEKNRENPYED